MLFNEILGNKKVAGQLTQMVNSGRLPHSLLFLGPAGCSKLAVALAFSQYIQCEERSAENACGHCHNCLKAAKFIHPDIHFSFPTVGTNIASDQYLQPWRTAMAESPYMSINQWLAWMGGEGKEAVFQNKQANINKEECNRIIKKLSLKAFEGQYKVLIMWLPEYLGREGNRLLKMIEEPPPKTIFILVAENQELILNTILSRCQIVKFQRLKDEEVVEGLMKKTGIPESEATPLAQLSNGNFEEALTLFEQRENNYAKFFLDWMRKCYKGHGVELVSWVDNFASMGRERQKHFVQYGLHFWCEFLSLKISGNSTRVRLQEAEIKTASNMSKVISLPQLEEIVQLFNDCFYYLERNANPKILFLDTSIKMNKILK